MLINPECHFISNFSEFQRLEAFYDKLRPTYIIVDTETNSVITKTALLFGIGISFNEKKGFYIIWRDQQGVEVFSKEEQQYISQWLLECCKKSKLIGQNLSFDVLILENNCDITLDEYIYADTALLKHTIDEEPPFGLKEVGYLLFGDSAVSAQLDLKASVIENGGKWLKEQKDMYKADSYILGKYCIHDCVLTYEVFKYYRPKLKEQGLEQFYFQDEVMPLYKNVTINMKRKGFPIDVAHFESLRENITKDIDQLEQTIQESIAEEVDVFVAELLEKEFPIKNSGNFVKAAAEYLKIPLPISKKKNKETGEVIESVTLAEKAVKQQSEANPEHQWFYNWILDDNVKIPVQILKNTYGIQKKMYNDKYPEEKYIFNLNSSDHLAEWLVKIRGHKAELTETGKAKVDKEFIEQLTSEDEIISKLQDYKKLQKIKSTYIEGILDKSVDGIIYTDMLQHGTTSGRYSSRAPNCLSMDTEILTNSGWKSYDNLKLTDKVAQFDNGQITWKNPTNIWKSEKSIRSMTSIKNSHSDILTTSDHRILYQNDDSLQYQVREAKNITNSGRLLHGAYCHEGSLEIEENLLRFLIAVQADSEIRKDSRKVRFVFNKKRKYDRLLEILSGLNFSYEDKSKNDRYEILIEDVKDVVLNYLSWDKTFPATWAQLTPVLRSVILEEIFYWDGSYTRKSNYSSNNELNVDLIQSLCVLEGWRAHKRIYKTKAGNDNYQLDITRRNYSLLDNRQVINFEEECEVWCIQIPSEKFVARRGKDTFIIYNCQNLPRIKDEESGISENVLKYVNAIRKGFVAKEGYKIVNADYSSLEPVCFAHMSDEQKIRDIFINGKDLYSQVAIDVNKLEGVYSADKKADNFLKKFRPELRQLWKVPTLGIVYGMQEGRLVESIGCSYEEAKQIIKDYLITYPNLKRYMTRCELEAKTKGYVKTSFGRIRHLSKAQELYRKYGNDLLDRRWAKAKGLLDERYKLKNLLNNAKNFRIQGLAAHIVNRAMIAITEEFKKANLTAYIGLQVHDEVTCICKESEVESVIKIMKNCMENTTKISVPLIADPLVAQNWGEAK